MLYKLSWKLLWHNPLQALFLIFITSFSIALSVFLLSTGQGLHQGLVKATEPFTLIVGSQGSANQLVLHTVFLQDKPIGNISYEEVEHLRADTERVKSAIPLAYGDNYQGFPIVGTEPGIFDIKPNPKAPNWLRLQSGERFDAPYEAVIGHQAAEMAGLNIGDTFYSIHGHVAAGKAHDEHAYTVVGILEPVGGPYDKAIFTDIESIWDSHHEHGDTEHNHDDAHRHDRHEGGDVHGEHDIDSGHEHEHDAAKGEHAAHGHAHEHEQVDAIHEHEHDHEHDHEHEHEHEHGDTLHEDEGDREHEAESTEHRHASESKEGSEASHAHDGRETTAVMIEPVSYATAYQLALEYRQGSKAHGNAQLVFPSQVVVQLFSVMGQGLKIWLPIGVAIILLSFVVMLVSVYVSNLGRLREQAVLKALGASDRELLIIAFLQNAYLILLGCAVGWIIGQVGYVAVVRLMSDTTAISMGLGIERDGIFLTVGAAALGIACSMIPAALMRKKDIQTYL